jgi:GST-like protein
MAQENTLPAFRSLNPNGKIPAIIDPDGPDGQPIGVFESGAILLYLAEKTGRFLAASGPARWEAIQWICWQMAGLGPMFGQVGYFHKFAGREIEDPRPRQRYVDEARRLLGVLDARLQDREWIAGDYGIADMATLGWVNNLITFYEAAELVGYAEFRQVDAWLQRGLQRPGVQRGLLIPKV